MDKAVVANVISGLKTMCLNLNFVSGNWLRNLYVSNMTHLLDVHG